jgi:hypothetical protein
MTADFGNGNSFTLKPPPDGLSEFKVETANYSAEYGRSGGAVINAVTKSGQNRFFGDVWEYNRNAYFDAEDYFLKQARLRRPKYNRNQFGFSLGGPITIPRLYQARIGPSSSSTTKARGFVRDRPIPRPCLPRSSGARASPTTPTS